MELEEKSILEPAAGDLSEGPAEQLVGELLNGKWLVHERLTRDHGDTGQSRSACYRAVAKDGRIVFVKAFDFRQDDKSGDTELLERNVREFNHDRKIHEYCNKLRRVTQILDSGTVAIADQAVHFIVCEFAPKSFRILQWPAAGLVDTILM